MAKKIVGRNFNDGLVGNQLTNPNPGTTLFTIGQSFSVTTNTQPRQFKDYSNTTSSFSNPITLETLGSTSHTVNKEVTLNNTQVFLNLNKKDISNYALFGSLKEFIRVSIEQIIQKYPASLFVSNVIDGDIKITVLNYSFNAGQNASTFDVPVTTIINKFGLSYSDSASLFGTTTDLKNLSSNFEKYSILTGTGSTEFKISAFTGSSAVTSGYLKLIVNGNPFPSASGGTLSTNYHIKPNFDIVENFFTGLENFESYILNRDVNPKYTAIFSTPLETEEGVFLLTEKQFTWPVSDGYNIDIDGALYSLYLNDLLLLGENNDNYKTNLIARFFTAESIKEFDTKDQRVSKLLHIYGREFDEIRTFIDSIAFANRVTYSKEENVSDNLVKNLAKVLGWGVLNSVSEDDILTSFLGAETNIALSGLSKNMTPAEADIELWRRILLNTSWLFKSKGTRKAIEFIFKFIGAPDCLISIDEHVYLTSGPLNPSQVELNLFNASIPQLSAPIAEVEASGNFTLDVVPFNLNFGSINLTTLTNSPGVSTGTVDNNTNNFSAIISVNGNVLCSVPQTQIFASGQDNANLQGVQLIVTAINSNTTSNYFAFDVNQDIFLIAKPGLGISGNGVINIQTNAVVINSTELTGGTDAISSVQGSGITPDMSVVPIDENGYPRTLTETSGYYFQMSGGWRTEVTVSPMNDKNTNSPVGIHYGPFDAGQSYWDPFKSIGFTLNKTVDNQKSWIALTGQTSTRRDDDDDTLYSVNDSRLTLNSKEVMMSLDFAKAIECDVYNYIKIANCPINTSGLTYPYPNTYLTRMNVDDLSFAEFIDNAYSHFINAKNRKVIDDGKGGGYPTLKKLYMDYYYRSQTNCGVLSNTLSFDDVLGYVNKLDSFWMKLIDQLVPATIIWQGGEKYRNTVFNRQKFVYKHGINDGSEFEKKQADEIAGSLCSSGCIDGGATVPGGNIRPPQFTGTTQPKDNAKGIIEDFLAPYFTFNKTHSIPSSTFDIFPMPISINPLVANMLEVIVPYYGQHLPNETISLTTVSGSSGVFSFATVENSSNSYNFRTQESGSFSLDTGLIIDENYAAYSNDILRVKEYIEQNLIDFTQPEYYMSGASKINTGLTSTTVHNISTDGIKSYEFIFTAGTEQLTATTVLFKYDIFKMLKLGDGEGSIEVPGIVSGFTGFTNTSLKNKLVPRSIWTAQTGTTKTYSDTAPEITNEGEYLIKGSYLFTGLTSFYNIGTGGTSSGFTLDTLDLSYSGTLPYSIYDTSVDWYFVIIQNPEKPIINTTFVTTGFTGSACTGLVLVHEEIPLIILNGQSGFTTSQKAVGDIMVNVNGNTLIPAENLTFINSNLTPGEVYIDQISDPLVDLIYLRTPIYKEFADTLSAVYLTGPCAQGIISEGLYITGITSGATASSSDKVFFNTGTSKYEYYTDRPIIDASQIVFILNGNKLGNGIDFYPSISNQFRLILNEGLAIGDTIRVYYLDGQGFTSNSTVNNANFAVTWNVSPLTDTDNGEFTLQIAYDTDLTYSSVQYSSITPYYSFTIHTGTTGNSSTFISSPTDQTYMSTIVLDQANQNFVMRVRSDRYFTTVSGQTFTTTTFSDNVFFQTDATLNSY